MHGHGVIYQVYPRSFADSNGDGIGDIPGIVANLDHLAWLGVDAIWTSPTFPSPNVDWGYDVSDYQERPPGLRDARRPRRADRGGAAARHRHLARPRPESHLRPARMVQRPARVLRLVERDPERLEVDLHAGQRVAVRPTPQALLPAPVRATSSPTSTGGTPTCAPSSIRSSASGSTAASRGFRIDVAHGLVNDRELRDGIEHMRERPEVHDIYRSWQEIAARVRPEADADGRDLVKLEKMFAVLPGPRPRAELRLLQRRLHDRELRPIVEKTMKGLPRRRDAVWFG